MTRRRWLLHLAAVLGYALVAVVFSWPLLPNAATHLTGDPGGDTGVYIWNQWVFQHGAFVEGRNPLTTEHIFSLSSRPVDLSQHNYTLFLDLLAMPLLGWLGTVVTFNLVYLAVVVLTAWMTFVLARRITGGAVFESWLAGAVFVECTKTQTSACRLMRAVCASSKVSIKWQEALSLASITIRAPAASFSGPMVIT